MHTIAGEVDNTRSGGMGVRVRSDAHSSVVEGPALPCLAIGITGIKSLNGLLFRF